MTAEAIRKRLDAALPGPWRPGKAGNSVITDGTNGGDPSTDDWYGGQVVCESSPWATVEFIAHSRADIERLLAVAEAAKKIAHDDPLQVRVTPELTDALAALDDPS